MALRATAASDDADLLFFPWHLPLEDWPTDQTLALPRGISRHTVRFVSTHRGVYAVKETLEHTARREYDLLFELERRGIPCVEPTAIISGRETLSGEELPAALVTRHLSFSLPYRGLFSSVLTPDTTNRLLDALALLLARLHVAGFAWNDCSLSNTLFRRDAGAFAAYLVDAETGELRPRLSNGQRLYDIDTAMMNVAGELMDLQAGGRLTDSLDPWELAQELQSRYNGLWHELTSSSEVPIHQRHVLEGRIRRLNELGFDVAEIEVSSDPGVGLIVKPKVVDSGHHSRRLLRLTGLDVEENQARRLLNDLDSYTATKNADFTEDAAAHAWVTEVFERVVGTVPPDMRLKLEPAEIFHEVLEHRWFMGERLERPVGLFEAARDYVATELTQRPDEAAVLGSRMGRPTVERDDVDLLDEDATGELKPYR